MEDIDGGTERLHVCEARIGYTFRDPQLLALALTHASDKAGRLDLELENDDPEPVHDAEPLDNERLEFLGDSVLGMVVCDELFHRYPHAAEGELTNVKSVVVSRRTLARLSDAIGIPEFMSLGKGMTTYERLPESLRANVFEAVVAAIYLDGGLDEARRFVLKHIGEQIRRVERDEHRRNYKSVLQQYTQREFSATPTYRVIREEGPDHIKEFEIVAVIGERQYATGRGKSKKDAEQEAARATLRMLEEEAGD
jgi:ribonuclease-3